MIDTIKDTYYRVKAFRRKWFPIGDSDMFLFAVFIILLALGLIMLSSATYISASYYKGDPYFYVKKQVLVLFFSLFFFVAAATFRFDRIPRKLTAFIASFLSLGMLLWAFAWGAVFHGTRRYISLGFFQFQPSDVAKLGLIITLAALLDYNHNRVVSRKPLQTKFARKVNSITKKPLINESIAPIVCYGLIVAVYGVLVLIGSHLSGTVLIVIIGAVMLFLGEIRLKWFFGTLLAGGGLGYFVFQLLLQIGVLKQYQLERIFSWQDKDADLLSGRWQITEALYAIGSGGLFGKGLGQSTMKHLYVAELQNDMIFSIVVEELGLVGAAIILLLFALLLWRCVLIGIRNPDRYKAMLACGIAFHLGIQVVLNILVVTDLLPNTGIALPFFSYGGTTLVVTMTEIGIILNISKTSKIRRRY